MNILLLAAGKGQRFQDVGYPPKPLIELNGLPMWEAVLSNFLTQLPGEHEVIVATKVEYEITSNKYKIVNLEGPQMGAAHSASQAAKHFKDQDAGLWVLNCDQFITFDGVALATLLAEKDPDGLLLHFNEPNGETKWGRSIIDNGLITEIVEKTPVSPNAHTGHYYWRCTWWLEAGYKGIVCNNIKINGEFFISPIFNDMIECGATEIYPFFVEEFIGIGVPDDLEAYLNGKVE